MNIANYFNLGIIFVSILTCISVIFFLIKIYSRKESIIKKIFTISAMYLSTGYIFWAIAEIFWGIYAYQGKDPTFGHIDLFYLLGYLFIFLGAWYFLYNLLHEKKNQTKKYLIFSLIIITIISILVTSLLVKGEEMGLQLFLLYAYPILSGILLVSCGLLSFLFKEEPFMHLFFLMLFFSAIFLYIGDLNYAYYASKDVYSYPGIISDACYFLQYLFSSISFFYISIKTKEEK